MNKTDKLKKVFDFIAEYLSDDETQSIKVDEPEVNVSEMELTNKGEDTIKRAYTIMKKLDERDKQNAIINTEVKKATDPLKEELDKLKKEYETNVKLDTEEEIKETLKEEVKDKVVVSFNDENGAKNILEVEPKEIKSILDGSIVGVSSKSKKVKK